VYPGTTAGQTKVYEDDGATTDYISGKSTWTTVRYSQRTATDLVLTIDPATGGYPEFPMTRTYVVRLVNSLPITSATVNGVGITYSRSGGPNTWSYHGPRVTTVICTTPLSTSSSVTLSIKTFSVVDKFMSGIKGGLLHSALAKQAFDEINATPGTNSVNGGFLDQASSSGELFSYLAGKDTTTFGKLLNGYPALFQQAVAEVNSMHPRAPLTQLWDSDRNDNCLCGSQDCLNANNYYELLRVEGYQATEGEAGVIPLNDFWNEQITDNYATTQITSPTGYSAATFSDGLVYASQKQDTVPLAVYWNEARKDMLTVASDDGHSYAKQHGYLLVNASIGYVYPYTAVPLPRWSFGAELLASAFN